jgi:hypothetical protein
MTTLTLSRSFRNNLCNSFAHRLCTQGNITVKTDLAWADIAQPSAWIKWTWHTDMHNGADQHRLTSYYAQQAGDGTQKQGPCRGTTVVGWGDSNAGNDQWETINATVNHPNVESRFADDTFVARHAAGWRIMSRIVKTARSTSAGSASAFCTT